MKRVEGKNTTPMTSRREVNLQPVAIDVLKTLLLLNRRYGINYISRILLGFSSRFWKSDEHPVLETYGACRGKSREYVKLVIHRLVEEGFIEPARPNCATLQITEAGEAYLAAPSDIIVPRNKLTFSSYETYLQVKLREFRRVRAEEDQQEIWYIFGEYTLDQLTFRKPDSFKALAEVPGMNNYKAEAYGAGILAVFNEAHATFAELRRAALLKRVQNRRYQFVKKLWLDAQSAETISDEVGLTVGTVRRYIRDLHIAGEIDLRPWIEDRIDKKDLFKGAEYFRTVAKPRLKEAFTTLGLDYETLRLCQLYVTKVHSKQDAVQLPA